MRALPMKRRQKSLFNEILDNRLASASLYPLVVILLEAVAYLISPELTKELWVQSICCAFVFLLGVFHVCFRRFNPARLARECGFVSVSLEACKMDEYVDFVECVDADLGQVVSDDNEHPRRQLHRDVFVWRHANELKHGGVSHTSRISFASGDRHLGRATIACAGVWLPLSAKGRNVRVYRFDENVFPAGGKNSQEDAREWSTLLLRWVKFRSWWDCVLFSRKRYLLILPSILHKECLDGLRSACKLANKKKMHVFFLVEIEKTRMEAEFFVGPLASDETAWHFEPLTAAQCGRFCKAYADHNGLGERLKELRLICESEVPNMGCDQWALACSGGRPSRLVSFLHHGGRSQDVAMSIFFEEFDDPARITLELAFLWCLCVEKRRISSVTGNVNVDFEQIVRRLKGESHFPYRAIETFLRCGQLELTEYSKSEIELLFSNAPHKLSDEILIASLGSVAKDGVFRREIASWVRAIICEGKEGLYVEVISKAIVDSLLCCGAFIMRNGDLRSAFERITCLRNAVGLFSGDEPNVPSLNSRIELFFSMLRKRVHGLVLTQCIEELGFVDDEVVVCSVSAVLDDCEDDQEFLECCRSAVPLFGLTVCDPLSMPVFDRLYSAWKNQVADLCSDSESFLLPELLGLVTLCVFRAPCSSAEKADRAFKVAQEVISYLRNKNLHCIDEWQSLIESIHLADALKVSRSMSAILDKMTDVSRWSSVVILFAIVAVYFNDRYGAMREYIWPRLLNSLGSCKIPFDNCGRVLDLARWPVLWRRAYVRYVARQCSPWAIAVQLDEASSKKDGIGAMSAAEVLRYLPEIVRHFSMCVQAKSRGINQFEGVLHDGWRKIRQIARRESWFSAINLRARYWTVYWAVQILRDVMTTEEQNEWFNRLRNLCEGVSRELDPWYRTLILRTIRFIVKDHALFNGEQRRFLENFLVDHYPDEVLDDSLEVELNEWIVCAVELFQDCLGTNTPEHTPLQVFSRILFVLHRKHYGNNMCATGDWCVWFENLLGTTHEKTVLEAFESMAIDLWNRRCNGKRTEGISEYVCWILESPELMRKLCERLLMVRGRDPQSSDYTVLKSMCMIARLACYSSEDVAHKVLERIVPVCRAGLESYDAGTVERVSDLYLKFIVDISEKEVELGKSFGVVKNKFMALLRNQLCHDIDGQCDTPDAVLLWLGKIWSAPDFILMACDFEMQRRVVKKLFEIETSYSNSWFGALSDAWWHVIYRIVCAGWSTQVDDDQFLRMEKRYFNGEVDSCSLVKNSSILILSFALLILGRAVDVKEDFVRRMKCHFAKCQNLYREFEDKVSDSDRRRMLVPMMKFFDRPEVANAVRACEYERNENDSDN